MRDLEKSIEFFENLYNKKDKNITLKKIFPISI